VRTTVGSEIGRWRWGCGDTEEVAAASELRRAVAIGEQPVVADAHEAAGQHVE